MINLKYLRFLKHIFILFTFASCCKMGDNIVQINNLSGKDKCFKVYIILNNEEKDIGWNGRESLNQLKANEQNSFVIQYIYSDELDEFPNEKRIRIKYYDPVEINKPNSKTSKLINEEKFIEKKYSKEELENQNWEINFDGN